LVKRVRRSSKGHGGGRRGGRRLQYSAVGIFFFFLQIISSFVEGEG
jgi:hypothetical protein